MTSPAGWHLDPLPPDPGQPPLLRYWDGERWTEHTSPAPAQQYAGQYGAPYGAAVPTTPDGVPLASWAQRLGAYVIDVLILSGLSLVLWIPFLPTLVDSFKDFIDESERATENGAAQPSLYAQTDLIWVFVAVTLLSLVLGLVWQVVWLRRRGATPGKLALGLRVRLRETPGQLSYGTILKRWLAQSGVGIFGLVPFVGILTGIYNLLNGLWPLWDDKNQALHDKFARTNVVRTR